MHLPVFVVNGYVLLDPVGHRLVVDHDLAAFTGEGINDYLQDIQQLPGVSATVTQQRLGFFDLDVLLF